jgi:hypothetical protein
MTVWVVTRSREGWHTFEDVFETEEKAEAFIAAQPFHYLYHKEEREVR